MGWGIRRTATWKNYRTALYCSAALVTATLMSNVAMATDYTGGNGAQGTNGSFPSTGCVCNSGQAGGSGGANGFGGGNASTGDASRGYANSSLGGYGGAADAGGGGGAFYATGAGGAGGGAGGAGYLLTDGNTLTSGGAVTGGAGGYGGYSAVWYDPSGNNYGIDGGGGGGGGGSGVIATGTVSLTNTGSITGGVGGTGAFVNSYNSSYNSYAQANWGDSGSGGAGGYGVRADSATSLTLNNSGNITGGESGDHALIGENNTGGAGVYGQNIALTNTGGTIMGGYGKVEGAGVELTGGTNTLNISAGTITGNYYGVGVLVDGGTNIFNISGGSVSTPHGSIALKINGGTNTLNVTGGTLGAVYLGGGATTLQGTAFSNAVTLASGATAAVTIAGGDVSGITSFDNHGGLSLEAGRSLTLGSFTNESDGTLTLNAGAQLISSNLNLIAGSTITGAGALSSGSAAFSLSSGAISAALAGTGGLTKTGSSTLTLTGSNTYTGGTNITGGTLAIGAGALGGGDVHMAQGTTIQFTGSSFSTSNNIFITGDPTFDVASGTIQTVSGVIADDTSTSPVVPGVVEKTGSGTLVLSGANTYSGGTILSGGGLMLGSDSVWSSGAIVSSAIGTGVLTLDGSTLIATANRTLYNDIHLTANGGGIYASSSLELFGNITDAAAPATLTLSGTGPIYLGGSNSYASATYIGSGSEVIFDQAASASANSDFTVDGTLDVRELSGGATTIKSLSGSGTVTNHLAGNSILTIANGSGQTATFSGTISDYGGGNPHLGIAINGAGTQVFANANNYSGGTTLTAGALEIANASALGSGQIVFNGGTLKTDGAYTIANAVRLDAGGGTLANGTNAINLSGDLTDGSTPGALALTGSGAVTLTGTNSFSGGLSVAGTLVATGAGTLGSGTVTLQSGAALSLASAGAIYANAIKLAGNATISAASSLDVALNGVISDDGASHGAVTFTGNAAGNSYLAVGGINSYSGGTYLHNVLIAANNDSAFGTGAVTMDAALVSSQNSSVTLANNIVVASGNGAVFQLDGNGIILDGTVSDATTGGKVTLDLTHDAIAAGTVVFNGNNSYSGGTVIGGGDTAVAGTDTAFGTGAITIAGGVLAAGGSVPLTLANDIQLDTAGAGIRGNGAQLTLNGILSNGTSGAGHLIVGSGGAGDSSTVILSGNNTFTGGLTVAGGTVVAANSAAFGTGTIDMAGGTTLGYANGVSVANTLNLTGNVTFSVASGNSAIQSGDIGDDTPATAYAVTKTGTGTLAWTGTNTSSANVRLSAGTLEIGSYGALGSGTYTFDGGTLKLDGGWAISNNFQVLSGGTLDTNGYSTELTGDVSSDGSDGALTITGAGSVLISGTNNLAGGATLGANTLLTAAGASGLGAGDVSMAAGSSIRFTTTSGTFTNRFALDGDPTFTVDSGLTTTLTGVISDAPSPATAGVLEKNGVGTLVLSAANTYSGGTKLLGGVLSADNNGALGSGTLTFDGGTLASGGNPALGNAVSINAGGGAIRVDGNTIELTGVIADGTGGGDVLTLTEGTVPGIVVLSGINTFSQGLNVGSGVTALARNSDAFGTGAIGLDGGDITPMSGSTLDIANDITVSVHGGTIKGNGTSFTVSGTITDLDAAHPGILTFGAGGTSDTSTVLVSGTNTYTGGTVVAGGTVKVSGTTALGDASSYVEMQSGTALAFAPGASLANALVLDDATAILNVASGTGTLSGGISQLTNVTGGFSKTGAGTLLLTGLSGNSGATMVSAGTLEVGDGAASSSSAYQVSSGATLKFDTSTAGYVLIGSLAGAGTVTSDTTLEVGGAGANTDDTTFAGTVTTQNLTYNGGGTMTLTGSGNAIDALIVCSCVTEGGITLSGGSLTASAGVGVQGGSFTVAGGAQLTAAALAQSSGIVAIRGNGTVVDATQAGAGVIQIYANGGGAPVFTVSSGARVTSDNLLAGITSGTDAPQITLTGTGTVMNLTGGVQLNNGAVLTVADGASLSTSSINLDSNAVLAIGNGATAGTIGDASTTIQGLSSGTSLVANFTGAGTLVTLVTGSLAMNVQAGNLTLTNVLNDYSGGTTIAHDATLTVQNNSMGTGAIIDNGTLVLDNRAAVTFANILTGSGGLTQSGNGALTLATAQVYTGVTEIAPNATLFLTGTGDLSHSSEILADGTFDVSGVSASGVSITRLSGDGDVEIGSKALTVTGNGGIFSGILSDGGAHGSLRLLGNQILNGVISLTGTTTIGANTTVTVSGPNALGGGTLEFKAGSVLKFGATGTYTNPMTFDVGAPVFDVAGQTVTLSGVIGGPGDLAITGAGTLTLTNAANTYAGGTEIYGGSTLRVDADGELGTAAALQFGDAASQGTLKYAGAFALASGRAITLNAGGGVIDTNGLDVAIASAIGGTGGLTKAGTGVLTLSGTSTYGGPTLINAGTLAVNGSIASAVTVATGAGLTGIGTVGTTSVASGGTIAPGNGTGTLHIAGNLTLAAGSTTAMQISTTAASQISVSGTAALNGTLAISQGAGAYTPGTDYKLVTASSVNGVFASVTGLSVNGLDANIVYSATAVDLTLTTPSSSTGGGTSGNSGSGSGGTGSGSAGSSGTSSGGGTSGSSSGTSSGGGTGGSSSSGTSSGGGTSGSSGGNSSGGGTSGSSSGTGGSGGSTGGGVVTSSFLFGSYGTTANQIAAGNALAAGANTGALYTAMGNQVAINRARIPAALGQLAGELHASLRGAAIQDSRLLRNGVLRHLEGTADGVQVWGDAFGGYGEQDGTGNAAAVHHNMAGVIIGADAGLAPGLRGGLAAAVTSQKVNVPDALSTASGGATHVLGYVSWNSGPMVLDLGGDYGWGANQIRRQIAVLSESETAHQSSQLGQVFGKFGYHFVGEDGWSAEPYAGLAYVAATTGAFAEAGGVGALSGASHTDHEIHSSLGVRGSWSDLQLDEGVSLTPRLDVAWHHAFNTLTPSQVLGFTSTGQSFSVLGVPLGKDAAEVQAGFDLKVSPDIILSLGYDGELGARDKSHAVQGGLSWSF
jgi:fibronectin-binding autotransporter adhesin